MRFPGKAKARPMLRTIDRYLIFKYWSTFLFTVLIFSLIAVVIDFSSKVEDFIEEAVTLREIIWDYEIHFVLMINGLLLPLYALIAVIFFTARLANISEIIALFNAGMSFRRLLYPYLLAASLITGFHLWANHYLIPLSNKTRLDFEHRYVWKHNDKGKTKDIHLFLQPGQKVYIRQYLRRDSSARDFQLERIVGNELREILRARKADWQEATGRWRLQDYEIHRFAGMEESLVLGRGEYLDTLLRLRPEDFTRYLNQKEMMITPELRAFVRSERNRGVANTRIYEVEMQRRTAEPFTILILTIIGLALASRKVRGGMGLHLATGILLGGLFIFLSKFSTTFSTNDSLPPMLGVWIPNLVFAVVAGVLVRRAQC